MKDIDEMIAKHHRDMTRGIIVIVLFTLLFVQLTIMYTLFVPLSTVGVMMFIPTMAIGMGVGYIPVSRLVNNLLPKL
jgi:hypothetical protein